HAALLLERVRLGTLAREKIELAAHCGDPSAILATGRRTARLPAKEWIQALVGFGEGVCTDALLAVAPLVETLAKVASPVRVVSGIEEKGLWFAHLCSPDHLVQTTIASREFAEAKGREYEPTGPGCGPFILFGCCLTYAF